MATQNNHHFSQQSGQVSAFAAAPTLPQPAIAPTTPDSRSGVIDAIRKAAQAIGQRFQRVEPVKPPEFTTVYAYLRADPHKQEFTADSTVTHLQNGTSNSQIPQQEYLLKYLRSNRQLRISATTVGQERVLQINIPRWEDAVAIRKRLTIYHPGAIAALHDAPTAQVTAGRPGNHSKPTAQPAARM